MLYVATDNGLASSGRLEKIPVEGGAAVTLADAIDNPSAIRIAGIYWSETGDWTVSYSGRVCRMRR